MREQRKHRRTKSNYSVRVSVPMFGRNLAPLSGTVTDMSDGGIFISHIPLTLFDLATEVEVSIFGDGWDPEMPPLSMRVVRVCEQGIALEYLETEFPLGDSCRLPESPAARPGL